MPDIRLSTDAANAVLDALRARIDANGRASLRIYAGTRPDRGGGGIGRSVLLGEARFGIPCAAKASGGVLTFNTVSPEEAAPASGMASWARIVDGDGAAVMDCGVSDALGTATVRLDDVNIKEGGEIRIISATLAI